MVLEGLLRRWGGGCGSLWGQGHWWQSYWGVLIGMSSPGVAILTLSLGPTQRPVSSSAGSLRPDNQQGGNIAPPISRQAAYRLPEPTATSKQTPWHSPAHQRDKTQNHPPEDRHQSLPPESLQKPLRSASPIRRQTLKQEELQSCNLWNGGWKHRKLYKMRWQRNVPDEGIR